VPTKKRLKRRIVEEGSSPVAQDEGGVAHQANKQPHGEIPLPQPYEGSMSNASMGGGAATPPQPPLYMFLMKFSWRSIKQMQKEGVVWTSLGPLPRWVPGPTTRWAPGTTQLALHDTCWREAQELRRRSTRIGSCTCLALYRGLLDVLN
jgi:hypothetical protein